MNFSNQVIWITGAASGIGAASAKAFAAAGGIVIISDVNADTGNKTAEAIRANGRRAEFIALDVTDYTALEAAGATIMQRHGALHHLFACAGTASRFTVAQMSPEAWRRVIDVNLTGAFLAAKAARPQIIQSGGGTITMISSIAAEHIAYLSGVHYAASKAGLTGLVRHMAFEFGPQRIRVNAIGPGPMSNRMGGGDIPDDRQAEISENLPLQHMVEPTDIANACLFLASSYARAITGVYLPVDCGFLAGRGASIRGYFNMHNDNAYSSRNENSDPNGKPA